MNTRMMFARAVAGCESRQTIGLVTFCGLLVATVIGISFPPAYFALINRLRTRRLCN